MSESDIIGEPEHHLVAPGDTLADLALRHDLGYGELVAANRGIDPWLPEEGRTVLLPKQHVLPAAQRNGIVINMGDQRLYFFQSGGAVLSFPIGIAVDNDAIVLGLTRIVRKRENPVWIPPASIRAERPELPDAVGPGPDNPLGSFALDLGWPAMVMHGTNRPYGIGRRVSHGCFRLYENDIATLYRLVSLGTPVNVVYQPVKLGWHDHALMLEIHPSANQMAELDERGDFTPDEPVELPGVVSGVIGPALHARIAWDVVAETAWRRTGMPVRIDLPPVLAPQR
ncbi:MAG: L,D-transpeptidase family protein [Ferrovibrio sp.]|uniref:L,D-transpeptidase family protein n=1 Tax=Ferrovibrio sp. TaxID=1917215 RepID=UPI00261C1E2C|nr:L,D-transpeptidase family protein [Ferrovibrio sp.]MCW0232438.1 L,D-transpeptidase family protein [Ferrovibrio sp.]